MWRDSESEHDFLNFSELSEQIAALATNNAMLPISIGVFGTWGTGKSTVLALAEKQLKASKPAPLIVKFDAWLYQGFDDAKAALMDVVAASLMEAAKGNEPLIAKVGKFAKRINYFRALGMAADFGIGMAFGIPPGLLTKAGGAIGSLVAGTGGSDDADALKEVRKEVATGWADLVKPKEEKSPPQEIAKFREEFSEILRELGRPVVLFIDNLDRCLPTAAIGTLEAVRLFLFLPGTAFIIAADEDMIRHSVRSHFEDINSRHVTDYLDKVIQVPFRVPQVSAEDLRAYMYSLFVSLHAPDKLGAVQTHLLDALQKGWDGKSFTKEEVNKLAGEPKNLLEALSVSDRLAPILVTAPRIGGNPRIVKRLLNSITLRQQLAGKRGMNVDLPTLAKLAVFERVADAKAAQKLYQMVMEEEDVSKHIDATANLKEARPELPAEWKAHEEFIEGWREMQPHFSQTKNLRPALFLSRDVMAPSKPAAGLSKAAGEALKALLATKSVTSDAAKKAAQGLSAPDRRAVMAELVKTLRERDWSKKPEGVHGAIVLASESGEAKAELKSYVLTLNVSEIEKGTLFLLKQNQLID
jgi:predicted KAP-like P-loop ATPase